jgi:hypothetical protein
MLFRRAAVLEAGGWREDQPCCQEHELLLRMILQGRRFGAGRESRSVYRYRGLDSVSRKDPLRVIQTRMELTDRLAGHLKAAGRLTSRHRKALFISQMESARSLFAREPQLAEEFSKKALSLGRAWTLASAALPLRYQIALRLLGFRRSELLAALLRK